LLRQFKGFLYSSGLGVETNQAKSLIYMSGAAISGNTFARMALGYRYLSGVLVEADCDTALEYYQRVAEDVVRSVELTGGQFIQRIRFQDEAENPSKASTFSNDILQYYQYMAEKGDPAAQVVLGQLYLQGGRGVQQDVDRAMKYFRPAADEGNSNAMAYLGKVLYT
jgi:SEL1 protein